jgi:hypothetical protein
VGLVGYELELRPGRAGNAPAYPESIKAENVPYYQRFGFEVTGELDVPGGGPTLWPMWRPPR